MEADGTVDLSIITCQFPGTTGLKYRNPLTQVLDHKSPFLPDQWSPQAWRLVKCSGQVLGPPQEGWQKLAHLCVRPLDRRLGTGKQQQDRKAGEEAGVKRKSRWGEEEVMLTGEEPQEKAMCYDSGLALAVAGDSNGNWLGQGKRGFPEKEISLQEGCRLEFGQKGGLAVPSPMGMLGVSRGPLDSSNNFVRHAANGLGGVIRGAGMWGEFAVGPRGRLSGPSGAVLGSFRGQMGGPRGNYEGSYGAAIGSFRGIRGNYEGSRGGARGSFRGARGDYNMSMEGKKGSFRGSRGGERGTFIGSRGGERGSFRGSRGEERGSFRGSRGGERGSFKGLMGGERGSFRGSVEGERAGLSLEA